MLDTAHLPLLPSQAGHLAPGLVWAFHAVPGRPVETLHPADIATALAARTGWVWLHVDLVDQRCHGWLGDTCTLPATARAILEGHDEGVALGHEDGVVHGICPDLHSELARQSTSVGRLRFAVSEHLLVTGRRHTLAAAEEVRARLSTGSAPLTAFALFEAILSAFSRNASLRLAAASTGLDAVEDRLVMENPGDERQRLKSVRRLAVSLHRPIAAMVALFEDEDRSAWAISAGGHEVLRRLAARLERLDREVVMLNDRARLLQEEIAAELADESNRSLRVLAVISALLLPGTLIVGIFGMNTADLPLTHTHAGFIIALLLGAGATGLFYWILRRAGANLRL